MADFLVRSDDVEMIKDVCLKSMFERSSRTEGKKADGSGTILEINEQFSQMGSFAYISSYSNIF